MLPAPLGAAAFNSALLKRVTQAVEVSGAKSTLAAFKASERGILQLCDTRDMCSRPVNENSRCM